MVSWVCVADIIAQLRHCNTTCAPPAGALGENTGGWVLTAFCWQFFVGLLESEISRENKKTARPTCLLLGFNKNYIITTFLLRSQKRGAETANTRNKVLQNTKTKIKIFVKFAKGCENDVVRSFLLESAHCGTPISQPQLSE